MEETQGASAGKKAASLCWAIGCAGLIILVMAAVAGPKLVAARVPGNEAAAIGALKSVHNAQLLHREKGGDRYADFATLHEQNLIDAVLASGTKQGYRFELVSIADATSAFVVTAAPLEPGETGRRCFAIDQEGVLYVSHLGPIQVDPATGALPSNLERLGR